MKYGNIALSERGKAAPFAILTVFLGFLIAALYLLWPNARPDLTALDWDDGEAYLSLSYSLTHGLGYTRNLSSMVYVPHTTWPPILPLLYAPVTSLGLPLDWTALKYYLIAIHMTALCCAGIYTIRVSGSLISGCISAFLLATTPFFWLASRSALSEGPTICFVIFILYVQDVVWAARRPSLPLLSLLGMLSGLGMLLRGTNIGLLISPLAYLTGSRQTLLKGWDAVLALVVYAGCFVVPPLLWAVRNHSIDAHGLGFDGIDQMRMLFAATPADASSPLIAPLDLLRGMIPKMKEITFVLPDIMIPGLWNLAWWNLPASSFLALLFCVILGAVTVPLNGFGLPLALFLLPYSCILLLYSWGSSLRFWIPVCCLSLLLVVINHGPRVVGLLARKRRIVLVICGTLCVVNLGVFAYRFERQPYFDEYGDMLAVFQQARLLLPASSSVWSTHAGLFVLQTGLDAPMTVSGRDLLPRYTAAIVHDQPRDRRVNSFLLSKPWLVTASSLALPPGSRLLAQVGTWCLYVFAQPITERELAQNYGAGWLRRF